MVHRLRRVEEETAMPRKLTTLQKGLLAIAGAAAVFLLYDQFGGPPPASAADTASSAATPAAAQPAPAAIEPKPTIPIGARLRAMEASDLARPADPFTRGTAPMAITTVSTAPSSTFADRYRMTGAITSGSVRSAIVNGVLVKRGQVLDGYRLIDVTASSATFESAGERVVLRMGGVEASSTPDSTGPRRRGPATR
jgi:hypothetical protein